MRRERVDDPIRGPPGFAVPAIFVVRYTGTRIRHRGQCMERLKARTRQAERARIACERHDVGH